jgi:uncharacterized phage infection (PIP) family protein YhgE
MQVRLNAILLPLALAFAMQPLVSCKSTEVHDEAGAAASRIDALSSIAGQAQRRLDNTLNALTKVRDDAKTNPAPAFASFSDELSHYGSELNNLASTRNSMKSTVEGWLANYEKQNATIQDESLKEKANERLAEHRTKVTEVGTRIDALMTDAEATHKLLKDMRAYLGGDLTPQGIDSVSGRIGDISSDGRKVASRLGEFRDAALNTASALRSAQAPPPTKQ